MMRLFWLTILTLGFSFSSLHAQLGVKKGGGFFGFGKEKEQLSSDLFPSESEASRAAQQAASSDDANIFRGGTPQPVESTSYVIEDGEKVEKKGGFFSRNKKEESRPVIDPVPATRAPAVSEIPAEALAGSEEKEKKGGILSFNPFKKSDEPEPVMSEPIASQPVAATVTEPAPAPAQTSSPAPEAAPKPAAESTDVPTFVSTAPPEAEKKKESKIAGLVSPIKNLNPIPSMKKDVDYTGAETIIQDGEIVDEEPDDFVMEVESTETGTREPPKVVNGVKTYSSWDDVDARALSPADKILNQIR